MGEVLVAIVDRLEPAAIHHDRAAGEQAHPAAKRNEADADLAQRPADPGGSLSRWMDVDQRDWLKPACNGQLSAQTLNQANGYAITLLRLEPEEADMKEESELDGAPRFRS
ncbi:MAG TPA: hypothetical protein VHG92_01040 [Afifellaceae bacterium]|nr:hypothetical protein [Afifellaceae bacterium]